MRVLGIDTSNYTTSVALAEEEEFRQARQILSVEKGERGLRQSNALFLHTVNLPKLVSSLAPMGGIDAVAYSAYPRDVEGSYMPCFLAGVSAAETAAAALGVPAYRFSHQAGHLMAAVKTSGDPELGARDFLAFHLSGGTTELLYVKPQDDIGFSAEIVGRTLDISAGQLIDRVGVMLGLSFPCGGELEVLARSSERTFKPHICVKESDCNLSGAENMASNMHGKGEADKDIARFTLAFVANTVLQMSRHARERYPALPILYAGGVMRNGFIRSVLEQALPNIRFASAELSSDNAVGIAYLGMERLKREREEGWREGS